MPDYLDQLDQLDGLLRSVSRRLFGLARSVAQEHGLSHSSIAVMRQLHRTPGTTVSEMARQTGLAKSHISTTVESLAETGILEKRRDTKDQRLLRIYLTGKATTHFEDVHKTVRARLADVASTLDREQLDAIVIGLEALEQALARHAPDSTPPGDDHP